MTAGKGTWRKAAGVLLVAALAGCAATPRPAPRAEAPPTADKPTPVVAMPRAGGYYQDDGPGDNPPPDIERIPDAQPRPEPLHRFANNPYIVFGRTYTPDVSDRPYVAEGIASWYGRKFHGQRTSSGEPYDMYAMTAAHPTLPIPSYARVTNLETGKSVVVRINDRGPFHSDRLIDLSYTAAYKLGIVRKGSGRVRVERIDPSAPAAPAVADAAVPAAGEDGYWVQLAAFTVAANAEQMLSRLKVQLAELADRLRLVEADGMVRLRAGPYASRTEADQAAALVRRATDLVPLVTR